MSTRWAFRSDGLVFWLLCGSLGAFVHTRWGRVCILCHGVPRAFYRRFLFRRIDSSCWELRRRSLAAAAAAAAIIVFKFYREIAGGCSGGRWIPQWCSDGDGARTFHSRGIHPPSFSLAQVRLPTLNMMLPREATNVRANFGLFAPFKSALYWDCIYSKHSFFIIVQNVFFWVISCKVILKHKIKGFAWLQFLKLTFNIFWKRLWIAIFLFKKGRSFKKIKKLKIFLYCVAIF